jgi:hypothetical protein
MHLDDTLKIKGRYRVTEADPARAPKEYKAILDFLAKWPLAKVLPGNRAYHRFTLQGLIERYHALAQVRTLEYENLTPTVGRNVLARILANDTTYTGIVNYAALGSDATPPTSGDTTLGTETYRKTIDSATSLNNVAYLSVFVPAGVATATHSEGGLFIDGNAGADTGQLFSHVLFSPPIDKTALSSLTLDISLTLT